MFLNAKYPLSTSFNDYFDNESLAIVVYIMGCCHNCHGCHNKDFQDIYYNKDTRMFTVEELSIEIQNFASRNKTNKICLEGGDPLYMQNLHPVKELLKMLKMKKLDVAIYTGFDIDEVINMDIKDFTYIKCGKYKQEHKQESKKTDKQIQLASKNQEIYDNDFNLLSEEGIMKFKGEEYV